MTPRISKNRLQAARTAILKAPRYPRGEWGWIGERGLKRLTKKRANKFLFACILDYQMNADVIWERCQEFVEVELSDPPHLWDTIAAIPLLSWLKLTREFGGHGLHRFKDAAHRRVWRIGRRIRDEYAGDARLIWRKKTASQAAERMEELGAGPQISHMAAGGLTDTGWIKGSSDVKADRHVCRALGRILVGRSLDPNSAVALAREVNPRNPWRIDGPLFEIGRRHCSEVEPDCPDCPLRRQCAHARGK